MRQAPRPHPATALVNELLDTDRAFSAASATTDVVSGVSPMLAENVAMVMPAARRLSTSKAEALEALKSETDMAISRLAWMPIRGGVSADGLHGFTFGYMSLTRADRVQTPLKYLSYWIKGSEGWRVAVHRQGAAAPGNVSLQTMPPALPEELVPPTTDAAAIERHRSSLESAEREFAAEAQKIGLRAAFVRYGSEDAVNMGGDRSPTFIVGPEAIAAFVATGAPAAGSPVSWSPDRVIVASSGDLGVTIGFIRANPPGPDGTARPPAPFFTIWRRATAAASWKYVAE